MSFKSQHKLLFITKRKENIKTKVPDKSLGVSKILKAYSKDDEPTTSKMTQWVKVPILIPRINMIGENQFKCPLTSTGVSWHMYTTLPHTYHNKEV